MILVMDPGKPEQREYERSEAVVRLMAEVGGVWRVVSWGRWVPRGLRDALYNAVAARRHQWSRRSEACPLPSPELAARILP
jgi:predicted DCC family thiol-disulfide oxidoreductase YuxK